jgi:hypothetical protein
MKTAKEINIVTDFEEFKRLNFTIQELLGHFILVW